jgi:hypothetical protein
MKHHVAVTINSIQPGIMKSSFDNFFEAIMSMSAIAFLALMAMNTLPTAKFGAGLDDGPSRLHSRRQLAAATLTALLPAAAQAASSSSLHQLRDHNVPSTSPLNGSVPDKG